LRLSARVMVMVVMPSLDSTLTRPTGSSGILGRS
jgi:hypothetical protein